MKVVISKNVPGIRIGGFFDFLRVNMSFMNYPKLERVIKNGARQKWEAGENEKKQKPPRQGIEPWSLKQKTGVHTFPPVRHFK